MSDRKKDLSYDNPSKPFVGVRFVLLGFDSTEKTKFRLKLLEGGGADAGNYGPDCTHVIVRNLTYNDPICVAARRDEKTLVTALWIDHSFDVGMPVDSTSVMYRPPRDLDGIPGAKSLIICLTGYQRHDREDIMTMVSLMGASFSKPLVANKVTHLICYKFEGEKYQLAKKMKKIKLVNHSWLEDSLRAWELLPEDKYDKSGYELEMMEAEAKDSDEETQVIAPVKNADRRLGSALNIRTEMQSPYESPSKPGFSRNSLSLSASRNLTNISNNNEILSNLGKQTDFNQSSSFRGKVEGDLTSMSRSAKQSPNTDVAKLSENSFSMKTPERIGGNAGNTWTSSADKLRGSGSFNLGGGDLDREKTPYKRPALDLEQSTSFPEKKKRTVSSGSTKSLKMSFDAKRVVGCESLQKKTERSANVSPICYLGDEANLNLMEAIEVSRTVTSGDRQECSEEPRYCKGLKTRALSCKLDAKDLSSSRTKGSTTDVEMQQSDLHSVEPLTSAANVSEVEKSDGRVELDLAKEGHTGPRSKSLGRKTLGKKMTGSRSSISKGNTTNSKGSISFHKETSTNDSARYETGVVVREGCEKVGTEKVQMDCNDKHGPLNDETEAPEESNKLELDMFKQKPIGFEARHSEDVREDKMLDVNDITGNDLECNGAVGVNITGSSESSPLEDAGERKVTKAKKKTKQSRTKTKTKASLTGEKLENFREDAQKDIPNTKHDEETTEADDKETSSLPDATEARTVKKDAKSAANENETEVNKSVSGKKRGLSKSRPVGDAREKKVTKGNWHGLTNNKTKGSLVTENVETHCGDAQKSGSKTERDEETATADDKETISLGNKSKARPSKKSKRSKDEKEKGILTLGDQKVSTDEKAAGELASKPSNKPPEIGLEMVDLDSVKEVQSNKATSEPKYFIFCGHRLQRREFQKVIRRLKGRVCRDSHQWSYQATHFIVPDPIRRTEKFFAAAASGRWILKKDYLTASNEAGKFLDELSYEWYKKCLTEDGAINLEAPRKWRLLKERTGHGAFYGMRIIIYGECIAPPLDTLKRVMKAGDGTILATSPPYTRFLQSGVDFAVVSPGMPRVDMWVQEFLRHEIPCIVPDYLVEYVCKPGYSLERHVQYNTQAWAEKSLKRLVNCMEEVVDDVTTPEDDDLACAVCGSRDRGDEMLICGNESGSAGCGIGTHIDCCDPPLADVPEEDWFCPECTAMRESTSIRKSPRKRASKSKK